MLGGTALLVRKTRAHAIMTAYMPTMADSASDTAAGLYGWRDRIARAEDESTGYVLSRSLLQKLAMQMPTSASKVKSFCNTRSVVSISDWN